jgi:NOL1/NOP2/sun family putative RNA methylase
LVVNSIPASPSFDEQMKRLLPEEWDVFANAMREPATRAVRLHRIGLVPCEPASWPLSIQTTYPIPPAVSKQLGSAVPWALNSYYLSPDSPLGQSAFQQAGAFYIQEPSAMAVVTALRPVPGERILDLCAAPGGKTTAIAKQMQGVGLLVANEIHPSRVLILAENLERLGVPAVVVNETPDRLAHAWPSEFDALLVDAPCSGEGMFRKNPEARAQWTPDSPTLCALRQREILTAAHVLLRPGGRLVYSTCTYNPLENEQIVVWLMDTFGYQVHPLPDWPGWQSGVPTWADGREALRHTRRLWPHKGLGEGHFVACLYKPLDRPTNESLHSPVIRKPSSAQIPKTETLPRMLWSQFTEKHMATKLPAAWDMPLVQGDHLFADELGQLPPAKLRVLRRGVALATVAQQRLIPHHALGMSLSMQGLVPGVALPTEERTALAYLRGEVIPPDEYRGIRLVSLDGMPLGWGKGLPDRVNNLYPKGLRRVDLAQLPTNSI